MVQLTFAVPEGRGESRYQVIAIPNNFKVLAEAMMQANHEAAIKAFGAALELGFPRKKRYGGLNEAASSLQSRRDDPRELCRRLLARDQLGRILEAERWLAQ